MSVGKSYYSPGSGSQREGHLEGLADAGTRLLCVAGASAYRTRVNSAVAFLADFAD